MHHTNTGKAFKALFKSKPGKQALSTYYAPYSLSLFTVNIASQLHYPQKTKQNLEMCQYPCGTDHALVYLNYSQGLTYYSVLPIKWPTTIVSVDIVHIQGKVSNVF